MKIFIFVLLLWSVPSFAADTPYLSSFVVCKFSGPESNKWGRPGAWDFYTAEKREQMLGEKQKIKWIVAPGTCVSLEGTDSTSRVKASFIMNDKCDENPVFDVFEDELIPGRYSAFVEGDRTLASVVTMLTEEQKYLQPWQVCDQFRGKGSYDMVLRYQGTSALHFETFDRYFGEVDAKGMLQLLDPEKAGQKVLTAQLPTKGLKLPIKSISGTSGGRRLMTITVKDSLKKEFEYGLLKVERDTIPTGHGSPISDIPSQICTYGTRGCYSRDNFHYDILENAKGEKRLLLFVEKAPKEKIFRLYDFASHKLLSSINVKTVCTNSDYFYGAGHLGKAPFVFMNNNSSVDGWWCRSGTEFHYDEQTDQLVVDRMYYDHS